MCIEKEKGSDAYHAKVLSKLSVSGWEQMPAIFGVGVREDYRQGACLRLVAASQRSKRESAGTG